MLRVSNIVIESNIITIKYLMRAVFLVFVFLSISISKL